MASVKTKIWTLILLILESVYWSISSWCSLSSHSYTSFAVSLSCLSASVLSVLSFSPILQILNNHQILPILPSKCFLILSPLLCILLFLPAFDLTHTAKLICATPGWSNWRATLIMPAPFPGISRTTLPYDFKLLKHAVSLSLSSYRPFFQSQVC